MSRFAKSFILCGRLVVDRLQGSEALVESAPEFTEQDWNTIGINRVGVQVHVTVNNKPVCRVPLEQGDCFSILCPKNQKCKIRKITLTGNWPTEVPDNLLELK